MKKADVKVILLGMFMSSPLFLHGMSDAEQLWNDIGNKLAHGQYPSDALLADFNEKLKGGNEELINRPYGGEDTVYGSRTLLFRATMIILNTWITKMFDGTLDRLPWVNEHLNRVVDMLYEYGARLTEDEKQKLGFTLEFLADTINNMNNDAVTAEFAVLTQLLDKIGVIFSKKIGTI